MSISDSNVLSALNNWNKNIRWTISAAGAKVPYLDLLLELCGPSLRWSTYRKEQNLYSYVPRSSTHPDSVFKSIVTSECSRLFRTNSHALTRKKEIDFFASRLFLRGFESSEVRPLLARQLKREADKTPSARLQQFWRSCAASTVPDVPRVRKFHLKLLYSSSVDRSRVQAVLRRHARLLNQVVPGSLPRTCISWRIQASRFRQLYRRNWKDCAVSAG